MPDEAVTDEAHLRIDRSAVAFAAEHGRLLLHHADDVASPTGERKKGLV